MKIVIDLPNENYQVILTKIMLASYGCKITELVDKNPTGEWIEHYDNSDGFTWPTCSRCMFKAYEDDYNFCPNCGACMIKEEEK